MEDYITIDFIRVNQPIGEFYIGTISWNDLINIAEADIRKIEEEDKMEGNFDSYLGIQRKLSPKRLEDIGDYVQTVDATFPTSVILSIYSISKYINDQDIKSLDIDFVNDHLDKIKEVKNIIISEKENKLLIRNQENVARILDGQHRIEGLKKGFSNPNLIAVPTFQFNVTIFVDLDIDDQAQVFSVINKAQTKVNKSLVYDLYEYARSRSPQKTAHDIVRLLNKKESSPFYRKIKILGTAENKELETIAQATFVELIIQYISKNPMQDRDLLKRKTMLGSSKKMAKLTDSAEIEKRIFRNLFIDEKDEIIMSVIWNYFSAVKERWPSAWDKNIKGNILNRSTGLVAFMRFLRPIYNSLNGNDGNISKKEFQKVLERTTLKDKDFNRDMYVPGSSGQAALFRDLLSQSGLG